MAAALTTKNAVAPIENIFVSLIDGRASSTQSSSSDATDPISFSP